jgi:hypothetical protein
MPEPPDAQAELFQLATELIGFAKALLAKNGEFFPVGGALTAQSEFRPITAYDGRENPPSSDLMQMLWDGMRTEAAAGKIRACGVCADVRIPTVDDSGKTDAIAVLLEHCETAPINVFVPYRKAGKKFEYEDMFTEPGEPHVFSEGRSAA